MSTAAVTAFRAGEYHLFAAKERKFVYLVPSGGIFELTPVAQRILDFSQRTDANSEGLVAHLTGLGYAETEIEETLTDLIDAGALISPDQLPEPRIDPPKNFPLQTLVLNLTNQCNLSCKYCYEYGEDKVATPDGKPKFMDDDTSKAAIDFYFAESQGTKALHVTFFGGETLMNFPLLKQVVTYANNKAKSEGRLIDYSLTTNATLLTPAIIDFLAENRIGVTVSIDGPPEMNALRVYQNGRGSYDIIAPKIKMLLEKHKTRPIAARVTLTADVTDVVKIFRHLTEDMGFQEVGFAPVTTSKDRLYAIGGTKMDSVIDQFKLLAGEYVEAAMEGRHHAFSNVTDTLSELYNGVNKSHPCGAGLGLAAVGPSGDISPCHRFVDSDTHSLGNLTTGIDREKQADFLHRGHIDQKYDCHTCWARPLCAGGCHHEAFVRYGDTGHPNLHYCDWIRDWTDTCLSAFGAISTHNPDFLQKFEKR